MPKNKIAMNINNNTTQFYLVNKDTGETMPLGTAKHIVTSNGKSDKPPRLGPISCTMCQTPQQAKELQWILDRPKRIQKYLKDMFRLNNQLKHEREYTSIY